jgi:hypothetical protein
MKNSTTIQHESAAQLQARKAIQRIQKYIETKYPKLAAVAKSQLIVECLIELGEEQKYLQAS